MDEIKLFEELQPPPPPDASRMRAAARARLTAATCASPAHPARQRRSTVVAVGAAAALVAAGTGYGLAAAQGGSRPLPTAASRGGASHLPSRSSHLPAAAAGLTAVHGCPGKYVTAGTLERVSGTRLILQGPPIQPPDGPDHHGGTRRAQPVTVATSPSTVITRPVSGTVGDITDGSQVTVQGTWSGERLAAQEVDIEAALPPAGSYAPPIPRLSHHVRTHMPQGALGPPMQNGTVVDAHDGSFTVVARNPIAGTPARIQVITSQSTKVVTKASTGLGQLALGANVVAVGRMGPHGVLTASTVAESSGVPTAIAGGPVKVRPSGCSASAITTAVLASR